MPPNDVQARLDRISSERQNLNAELESLKSEREGKVERRGGRVQPVMKSSRELQIEGRLRSLNSLEASVKRLDKERVEAQIRREDIRENVQEIRKKRREIITTNPAGIAGSEKRGELIREYSNLKGRQASLRGRSPVETQMPSTVSERDYYVVGGERLSEEEFRRFNAERFRSEFERKQEESRIGRTTSMVNVPESERFDVPIVQTVSKVRRDYESALARQVEGLGGDELIKQGVVRRTTAEDAGLVYGPVRYVYSENARQKAAKESGVLVPGVRSVERGGLRSRLALAADRLGFEAEFRETNPVRRQLKGLGSVAASAGVGAYDLGSDIVSFVKGGRERRKAIGDFFVSAYNDPSVVKTKAVALGGMVSAGALSFGSVLRSRPSGVAGEVAGAVAGGFVLGAGIEGLAGLSSARRFSSSLRVPRDVFIERTFGMEGAEATVRPGAVFKSSSGTQVVPGEISQYYRLQSPVRGPSVIYGRNLRGVITAGGEQYVTATGEVRSFFGLGRAKQFTALSRTSKEGVTSLRILQGDRVVSERVFSARKPDVVFTESIKANVQEEGLNALDFRLQSSNVAGRFAGVETNPKRPSYLRPGVGVVGEGRLLSRELLTTETLTPASVQRGSKPFRVNFETGEVSPSSLSIDLLRTQYEYVPGRPKLDPFRVTADAEGITKVRPAVSRTRQVGKVRAAYGIKYERLPSGLEEDLLKLYRSKRGEFSFGGESESVLRQQVRTPRPLASRASVGLKYFDPFPVGASESLSLGRFGLLGASSLFGETRALSVQKSSLRSRQNSVNLERLASGEFAIQGSRSFQRERQVSRSLSRQLSRQFSRQLSLQTGFQPKGVPQFTTPRGGFPSPATAPPPPFFVPFLRDVDDSRSRRGRRGMRQKSVYRPTVFSSVFNFFGREGRGGEFSGLGLRPLR